MKKLVKLGIHDWPKRTDFRRDQVVVEADDDTEAMVKAIAAAQKLWPGGKAKAFDVIRAADDAQVSINAVVEGKEKRPTLKARVNG